MEIGGKYVSKYTKFVFLRGGFSPQLSHLQYNLWIKKHVKLSQLFVLIQHFMLFFISGEKREVLRSSRHCLESNRRTAVSDGGRLLPHAK